jgi:hypothetical protein
MKTTIEVKGYQLVIDETEETVTVTATKDDEIVEEFTLELTEGSDDETIDSDEETIKGFDEFGEEGDFEESDDEEDEEDEEDFDESDMEEEEEGALESFQTFINKRRKK